MMSAHSPRAANTTSRRILYTYDTVVHGFAVQLTGDEAQLMSTSAGVIGVYKNRLIRCLTTRTPSFLGLDPGFGAWNDTDFGDGVIIGFVDTGIWPESPSFSDKGLGPVRTSWRGKCVDTSDFNASLCNNKLVGVKAFDAAAKAMAGRSNHGQHVPSPTDLYGHGTHVSSTAAGSEVHVTGMNVFSRVTARGMAPKARIAMYKACDSGVCLEADIVAAVDAAVKDGVDVLSMSLGGHPPQPPFHSDAIAIATFGAERAGIFVTLAGGNDGPNASSVVNMAPWMTTVGAATVDRQFSANLNLGDGIVLEGRSLYTEKANRTSTTPLVYSSCKKKNYPHNIKGKIVVCTDEALMTKDVKKAGASGLVYTDKTSQSPYGIEAFAFPLPSLTLSNTGGERLTAYMASTPYPVASFSFTCVAVIGKNRAPMVTGFSSRGPNPVVPELLKPDIIAPGVNILAAWTGWGAPLDKRNHYYRFLYGTSMACPHVAGVAALIKKKHGEWTPAMIRSALITTAALLDNTDREILDNAVIEGQQDATAATPFAAGAGHIRPQLAMDPGLVYDAGTRDYVDFLCALNYTMQQLRLFAPDMAACTSTKLPGGPSDLNYPSFVVIFNGRTNARTLTRTVTKVSEEAETYKVTVLAPKHVKVTVTPAILEFQKQYEKRSYTVEFRSDAGENNAKAEWEFGHIIWENTMRQVTSPVAFAWKN
ncbi:hypothetical protein PR202_ga29497 [Eleusine coracana subsp. coracana]|uniref:Subtilisin-like protease n=1 Tax=Eleusine coracana subsp. coracana TaxID=191504 RepID=A0AAV5DM86_ELECO|nr:hypothetical protein PR202_ga29497 [Eleusine coracana subsp. coracana]